MPGRVAVRDRTRVWTYADLVVHADRFSGTLLAAGVAVGDRVGIHLTRTCDLVAATLGVLRVGAVYTPLDPEYPAERLGFMADDADLKVIISEPATGWAVTDRAHVVHPGDLATDPDARAMGAVATVDGSAAYAIYTSGSTGRPKGALLTHGGLANILEFSRDTFGVAQDDSVLALASFSFDFAQLEILLPLICGGTVHLVGREVARDPERFIHELAERRPTLLMGTPSMFESLTRYGWVPRADLRIVCGGEALTERTAIALNSAECVWNIYGPTETTIFSTCTKVDPMDITIGVAVSNTVIEILRDGERCTAGVAGEICVGGIGLAIGYLNRPELTDKRFIPDPWRPGERLYRTGDIGRRRANGCIEFIGRMDDQIKIRGHRVELGEVEAWLTKHDAVREAAVVLSRGGPVQQLTAYVVMAGSGCDTGALRSFLADFLPPFAVPHRIEVLPDLPRSVNGKVDRLALARAHPPTADGERWWDGSDAGAWHDLLPAILAALGVTDVCPEDNFFDLGGDSLGAMALVTAAREHGLELRVSDVYNTSTLHALAARVTRVDGAPSGPFGGTPCLTPAQHRFFDWDYPQKHHYNVSLLADVDEKLDRDVLQRTLEIMCARHDALRSRFAFRNGRWKLSYAPVRDSVSLTCRAAGVRRANRQAENERLQRSLNLEAGPVWAASYTESDGGGELLLVFHHLVCDGVSLRNLARELCATYRHIAGGREPAIAAPPPSAAYATSLHGLVNGPLGPLFLATWLALPWSELRELPVDNQNGSLHWRHIRSRETAFSRANTQALLNAHRTQSTVDLLIAALTVALAEETSARAAAVAVCGHGRSDLTGASEYGDTVGWLNSIAPYVLAVARDQTDAGLLSSLCAQIGDIRRIESTWGALRFMHDDTVVRKRLAAAPQPDVYLNYFGHQMHDLGLVGPFRQISGDAGLDMTPERTQPYKLKVHADVEAGQLRMTWSYSADLQTESRIRRIADSCEQWLTRFISAWPTETELETAVTST